MKLKKIGSLALAGVMAVSMLAGCAGKTPETGNEGGAATTSSIVTVVNDAQDVVTFTSDAKLEEALQKAVELAGDTTTNKLTDYFANLSGVTKYSVNDYNTGIGNWGDKDTGLLTANEKSAISSINNLAKPTSEKGYAVGGKTFTYYTVEGIVGMNETAAKKIIANEIADLVEAQPTTTYKEGTTKEGDYYLDYTYDGTVSMVSDTDDLGMTTYYYVVVLNQNVSSTKMADPTKG